MLTDENNNIQTEISEEDEYYEQTEDSLDENVEDTSTRKLIWQAKDFSLREFQAMKQEENLLLQPDYQRKYVMDAKRASKLIESILLDIPIPVIYLAEEKDGTYSVIDGQQRLTSFIAYMENKMPRTDNTFKPFPLNGLKVLTELNKRHFSELDKQTQNKIKTTTIHTIIIKKESHEDIKFEIFERLNTGSIALNDDEIRNTIYRGKYMELLSELENGPLFHKLVGKENFKQRMIYRGMILRFFAFSSSTYLNYSSSMKTFCNKELRENRNLSNEKIAEYKTKFKLCLELVNSIFGEKAFRRFISGNKNNVNGNWSTTRISMALYDIQMCGFLNRDKGQIIRNADLIREELLKLMNSNDEFISSIEIRTSDREQVFKRFKIWFDTLDKIIGLPMTQPRFFSYSIKEQLYAQNKTCSICKQQILSIDDSEADHIIAYTNGGETSPDNAQLTHRYCNRAKGSTH